MKKIEEKIIVLQLFMQNLFKVNTVNCHFFLSASSNATFFINEYVIDISHFEELMEITIDNNLNFEDYFKRHCRKSSQKLHALSRVVSSLSLQHKRIIMKTFIYSQLIY